MKREALRLLRTNSSKTFFEESIKHFKTHLGRGYPENVIQETLSEVHFEDRNLYIASPPTKTKRTHENLAFCNTISTISAQLIKYKFL